jgi:hypothetical protein
MKHHLITLAFFAAAVASYLLGLRTGFIILVACGLFFEGVTWMRIRRGSRSKDGKRSASTGHA